MQVGDFYNNVELPCPDANVCAIVCVGSICKYQLRQDSGMSDKFILNHIVPDINGILDDVVVLVLSTTLLFFIYSDAMLGVATNPDKSLVLCIPVLGIGHDGW